MSDFHEQLINDYGKAIMDPIQQFNPKDYDRFIKRYHRLFASLLPSDRNSRVLDVGCGDGYFLKFLQSEGFSKLEGVDASNDRLEICKKYVTPTVYHSEAIEWLNAHPNEYEFISAHHIIEHFTDDKLIPFVQALARSLKENGRLILTTPNATSPWAGYNHYHDLTHRRLFATDSLSQLLSQARFKASFYPDGPVAFDFPSTLRWSVWKWREAWLKLQFRIDMGGTRGTQKTPLIVSPNLIAVAYKSKSS